MKRLTISTIALSALALTACGGTPSDSPADATSPTAAAADTGTQAPATMQRGPYEVTSSSGAELTFTLPTDQDHEALTEIEDYREAVHATDPVEYVVVDVDNRNGQESVGLPAITVFDQDGRTYDFNSITDYLDEIEPETDWESEGMPEVSTLVDGTEIPESEGTELSNQGIELHNQHTDNIEIGERGDVVLVYQGDDLPDVFTRVATYPYGTMFDGMDATPAD